MSSYPETSPLPLGLPRRLGSPRGWPAHSREDRAFQLVSVALLALVMVLAAAVAVGAIRPMPWSPMGQDGYVDQHPQVAVPEQPRPDAPR